ncbi:hypothetical protein FQR65_LT11825 [Abscondita terminalis]|nr:hypothetical protein FQR65_LT11825 [Abscondita terminalis]
MKKKSKEIKKVKKKKKTENISRAEEVRKYEETIAELNRQLALIRTSVSKVVSKNEKLEGRLQDLRSDKGEILVYLKRIIELNAQLITNLQTSISVKSGELQNIDDCKDVVEELEAEYEYMNDTLISRIDERKNRLVALEKTGQIRKQLMEKFDIQRKERNIQQNKFNEIFYETDRKLNIEKYRFKRELKSKLIILIKDFQDVTDFRVASATENIVKNGVWLHIEYESSICTFKKSERENQQLKKVNEKLRLEESLRKSEMNVAVNKCNFQLKLITDLLESYEELIEKLNDCREVNNEVSKLLEKLSDILNITKNLDEKLKILHQNLHADRCKRNTLKTKLEFLIIESNRLSLIVNSCVNDIEYLLENKNSIEWKQMFDHLLSVVGVYENEKTIRPDPKLILSSSVMYKKGDFGFVPKPVHLIVPTEQDKGVMLSPSFQNVKTEPTFTQFMYSEERECESEMYYDLSKARTDGRPLSDQLRFSANPRPTGGVVSKSALEKPFRIKFLYIAVGFVVGVILWVWCRKACYTEMAKEKKQEKIDTKTKKKPGIPKLTNVEKKFYELTIADINAKIEKLTAKEEELLQRNEVIESIIQNTTEDQKGQILSLKRTIDNQNQEIIELTEIISKCEEQPVSSVCDQIIEELQEQYNAKHQELTSEIKSLTGKLNALNEFRKQKDALLEKFQKQQSQVKDEENKHKRNMYALQKKFNSDKDKLKKDMELKLGQLSTEFQNDTVSRITTTTARVMRENVALDHDLGLLVETNNRLLNENFDLKCVNESLALMTSLHKKETYDAILKSGIQLKLISSLTQRHNEIAEELKRFKTISSESVRLRRELEDALSQKTKLEHQIRILEQNVHASKCDENALQTEVQCANLKFNRISLIMHQTTITIKTFIEDCKTKKVTKRDRITFLKYLLSTMTTSDEELTRPSIDSVKSLSGLYREGDLGFRPLPVALRSQFPLRHSKQIQIGPSFEQFIVEQIRREQAAQMEWSELEGEMEAEEEEKVEKDESHDKLALMVSEQTVLESVSSEESLLFTKSSELSEISSSTSELSLQFSVDSVTEEEEASEQSKLFTESVVEEEVEGEDEEERHLFF